MAKAGTSIITEKDGLIDFNDITKDALSDMMGIFSKLERRLIGQRVKRGIAQKVKEGKFVGNPKRIYGYDWVNSNFVANPYEVKVVKLIYSKWLEGESLGAIARYLNSKGYRGKLGGAFKHSTIKKIMTKQ